MAMNGDQIRLLIATIEVTSSALRLLLAERIADVPSDRQDKLLQVLEKCLARPRDAANATSAASLLSCSELTTWMPVAAGHLIEGVREQLRDLAVPDEPAESAGASGEVVTLRRSA